MSRTDCSPGTSSRTSRAACRPRAPRMTGRGHARGDLRRAGEAIIDSIREHNDELESEGGGPDARRGAPPWEDRGPGRRAGAGTRAGPGARAGQGVHLRVGTCISPSTGPRCWSWGAKWHGSRTSRVMIVDLDRDVYMGHEFAAEVLELGPGTETALGPGTLVTSIPLLLSADGMDAIVYSKQGQKAATASACCWPRRCCSRCPTGSRRARRAHRTDGRRPARGEPVRPSRAGRRRSCSAAGRSGRGGRRAAGSVGVETIVAADDSPGSAWRGRRGWAPAVVDPGEESPVEPAGPHLVVFEAVGVPGMIDDVLRLRTGPESRIVVVGGLHEHRRDQPLLRDQQGACRSSSCSPNDPREFAGSLRSIAEGEIDVAPLVTAKVGLDRVGVGVRRTPRWRPAGPTTRPPSRRRRQHPEVFAHKMVQASHRSLPRTAMSQTARRSPRSSGTRSAG